MSKFNPKRKPNVKKHLVRTIQTDVIAGQLDVQLEKQLGIDKVILRTSKYRKKLQSDVRKKIGER